MASEEQGFLPDFSSPDEKQAKTTGKFKLPTFTYKLPRPSVLTKKNAGPQTTTNATPLSVAATLARTKQGGAPKNIIGDAKAGQIATKDFIQKSRIEKGPSLNLNPTQSLVERIFGVLEYGLSWMNGYEYQKLYENEAGIITQDDIRDAAFAGRAINGEVPRIVGYADGQPQYSIKPTVSDREEIQRVEAYRRTAGYENSNAFLRGQYTFRGADVEAMKGADTTPGFLGLSEADVRGLGRDITLDWINLIPIEKAGSVAKIISETGKGAVAGAKLGREGKHGQWALKMLGQETDEVIATTPPATLSPKFQGMGGAAEEITEIAAQKINDKYAYKVGQTEVNPVQQMGATLADGLESGIKAFQRTMAQKSRDSFLEAYRKRDVTARGLLKTRVQKNTEDTFDVLSGNGQVLGTFPTKTEARVFAQEQKYGTSAEGIVKNTLNDLQNQITNALDEVEGEFIVPTEAQGQTKVEMPAETEQTGDIELFQPKEGTDGKWYFYDGKKVYKAPDEYTINRALEAVQYTEKEIVRPTVSKAKTGYVVRTADGQAYTAKTKKEAEAIAEAYVENSIPNAIAEARGKTTLDAPPERLTLEEILPIPATTEEAKDIKKLLTKINNIVKESTGTRPVYKKGIQERIENIVRGTDEIAKENAILGATSNKLLKELDNAIDLKDSNPFAFYSIILNGTPQQAVFSRAIRVADVDGSLATMQKLIGKYKKWEPGTPPVKVKTALKAALVDMRARIVAAKAGDFGVYDQLKAEFGQEVADKLQATGILNPALLKKGTDPAIREKAVKSYRASIDGILASIEDVRFKGIDDFLSRMKNESITVDEDSLLRIFKAIDPDESMLSKLDSKSTGVPTKVMLNELFLSDGLSSIRDMQLKLSHLGDTSNLLKLSNVAFDELLSQLIKDIRSPEGGKLTEYVATAIGLEKAQAKAARLAQLNGTPEGREVKAIALEAVAEANAETFAKLADIEGAVGAQVDTFDTWGKLVSRSTEEAYMEGSKAVSKRVFQQSRQRKMMNVIAGSHRFSLTRNKQTLDRKSLLDRTIKSFDAAADALGTVGIRMSVVKERADADFVNAFQSAKESKKKFDFSRDGHFAYLHMGDVLRIIRDTGGEDIAINAFFPNNRSAKGPVNYLSTNGLLDAARQALELQSKGKAIEVEELAARILAGGLDPKRYTEGFRKQYKELARDLAEHLARIDVLEALKDAHLQKSLGLADEYMAKAETIHDDIQKILYEAWQDSFARGDMSDEARVLRIRSHLRKIAYVADVYRVEGGEIAEAMYKSIAAMMLKKGEISTPNSADEVTKIIDDAERALVRKTINTLYTVEKPQFALKPGQTKFASSEQKAKIENRLTEAEGRYESVMARADEQFSPDAAVRRQFYKDRGAAQAILDRARLAAVEVGVSTRHFSANKAAGGSGSPWVPTERYNYDAEVRAAQRRSDVYDAARLGVDARTQYVADTRPEMPKVTILTGKRRDAYLAKQRQEMNVAQTEIAATKVANGEEVAAKLAENDHYEKLGATPEEAGHLYMQHAVAKGMIDNTEVVGHLADPDVYTGATRYGSGSRAPEGITRTQRIAERLYGPSNRRDVKDIMQNRETLSHRATASYSQLIRVIQLKLRNVSDAVIEDAWELISRGDDIAVDASDELKQAFNLLEAAWRPLIHSIETSVVGNRGIDGTTIAKTLERYGFLDSTNNAIKGIPSPAGLSPDEMHDWFRNLPFGSKAPDGLSAEYFDEYKAIQKAQGVTPLSGMVGIFQAIQTAAWEKGLVQDFVARFGYKRNNWSYERAKAEGYVELKATVGGDDLLRYLPDPEDGGLFPPEMARQFFSMAREWNQLFGDTLGAKMLRNKYVGAILTAVGTIKGLQTIVNPRHWSLNFMGDSLNAMIRGTVSPVHWGTAARLTGKSVARKARLSYGNRTQLKFDPEYMDRQVREAMRALNGQGRALEGTDATGRRVMGVMIYENGKPVRKNLSDDDLINLFEDYGILEESIYAEDIQGLVDYVEKDVTLRAEGGPRATLAKKLRQSASPRNIIRKGFKVPGDITANSANVPRAAHALKLLQEKTYRSMDEAMAEVAQEIALFHPTAKSLAASERQFGRFFTTYYTWIRMAFVGSWRMLLENYRELLVAQKTIDTWNRSQLRDDEAPLNIGQAFGGDKNLTPSYLSARSGVGRIAGSTLEELGVDVPTSQRNSVFAFNIPIMFFDALNYLAIDFDPYNTPEEEFFDFFMGSPGNGANPGLFQVMGKNISLIGEPAYKLLFGRDPSTGKKIEINSGADFVNEYILSNFSFENLTSGFLGMDPEKSDEDRFIQRIKFFPGLGFFDPNTEANKQNARNEINTRTREKIDEILRKDGVPQQGTWLRQRLENVAENIIKKEQKEKEENG